MTNASERSGQCARPPTARSVHNSYCRYAPTHGVSTPRIAVLASYGSPPHAGAGRCCVRPQARVGGRGVACTHAMRASSSVWGPERNPGVQSRRVWGTTALAVLRVVRGM